MLHDRRRVDEAKDPVAEDQRIHQLAAVVVARMDGDVSNPVARQGEVLGVRCDGDRAFVGKLRERVQVLVEQDLAIRLVADQEDLSPELPRLATQQVGQGFDERRGIHRAGRIIGRVDDHHPGSG